MSEVYSAIAAVQGELAKVGISKDGVNEQQKYKFRGIDQVYAALSPLLAKHGLCVLPRILSYDRSERTTMKPGYQGQPPKESVTFYVTVEAEFDFVSVKDASKHTVRTIGEAMDNGDKATNKAMSAAYKYAAFMAFAIPTEGDNDADGSTYDVTGRDEVPSRGSPAPRTKLEGPHTSKTALKKAITEIHGEIRQATSQAGINDILRKHRPTIDQAEQDWPELLSGDPNVPEDDGLRGMVKRRREALKQLEEGALGELLKTMRTSQTKRSLDDWVSLNQTFIDELTDEERRLFEAEYDAFEGGLEMVARAAA